MIIRATDKILVSHGFSAGNYAHAYQSQDLGDALRALGDRYPAHYVDAFVVGFYNSHETSEVPQCYRARLHAAHYSDAGKHLLSEGNVDARDWAHPTIDPSVEIYRLDYNGRFPAFSSVGCYTIAYHTQDNGTLCADCVNGDNGSDVGSDDVVNGNWIDPQWHVVACGTYDEGPALQCDHCGASIESSYGDPSAAESEA